MGKFTNLLGTVLDRFQLGLTGPMIKNDADELAVRDADDAAHAALQAALVRVFGDSIELNSGAASSGADWVMTLTRPGTGMSTDIDIVLPAATPSPGQVLSVTAYAAGVVTLGYATSEAGAANMMLVDETDLAFGSSSPLALLTKPANAVLLTTKVIIDTPFNGTPSVSIGVTGTASKYAAATHIDLTAAAGTVFDLDAGAPSVGTTEDIIATYSAGSASAGAARIQLVYGIPS